MDSSLHEVWQAAAGSPFFPTVNKGSQFWVAFLLLLLGFSLTGVFALNRSLVNVPVLGIPASLAIAFGVVYMFCAVGVYVLRYPKSPNFAASTEYEMAPETQPIFCAVATSTRPLYQLLKCINFAPRVHVQITEEGVRFAADHARVMQGVAFLDKALFSSYTVNLPAQEGDEPPELPNFQLSLSSVLEVLQILGQSMWPPALRKQTRILIEAISGTIEGDPFKITIEESGVKTTASLTTYLPEIPDDIPFDRNDLAFKIIMQSRTLLDSLAEISPTAPTKLTITAVRTSPFLSLAGIGDLGSSGVDFARGRDLLETFSIQERWSQCYKFDFVKSSSEAMRIATKVSLRGDGQGVLSLQFMVDVEGGKRSFLDFRFVPFIQHDDEDDAEGDGGAD
ncbi:hypothetical protein NM208_g9196 [Fusarium decemcellulare]|uniref:Uncharacterized protein n=1 Tax=Fusarium decemcellulare TaxID=57161 RepID=A0ACC1S2G0_9HYPO|nr:hypothetical protein NM208_g9196 [Fusarium decemcellulare]